MTYDIYYHIYYWFSDSYNKYIHLNNDIKMTVK